MCKDCSKSFKRQRLFRALISPFVEITEA
jgi:hypothetical protein